MDIHDLNKRRNSFIAKHGRKPTVMFMNDVDFDVLYMQFKEHLDHLMPAEVRMLSEKTKVVELLGMEIYVSPEIDEGEVFIGYLP